MIQVVFKENVALTALRKRWFVAFRNSHSRAIGNLLGLQGYRNYQRYLGMLVFETCILCRTLEANLRAEIKRAEVTSIMQALTWDCITCEGASLEANLAMERMQSHEVLLG